MMDDDDLLGCDTIYDTMARMAGWQYSISYQPIATDEQAVALLA